LGKNDDKAIIYHGVCVEVGSSFCVEGAWSGRYSEMAFPHAITFTGSGALFTPEGILFATPTHSVEPLYVLQAQGWLHCSNSLRLVLSSAADDIDYAYLYYDVDITCMAFGLKHRISRIPTRNHNWVTIHRYCNVIIGRDLSIKILQKKQPACFENYSDYRTLLNEEVSLTIQNSADAQRVVRYTPVSTISTGYDSAAVSVIAKEAGCREFVTFATSVDGTNDSGKQIGHILGLEVTEYDPTTYRSRNDLPEAEFAATGGGGGSVILTALEHRLSGKILLTGHYGGEAWERATNKGGINMVNWDSAGADMLYFRARVGFTFLAVPSIGYSQYMSLQSIANSEEMRPWSLLREEYDRPIPRRIVEEAGVPRELFGHTKKFAARSLNYCNPISVIEPNLQHVMAETSYRHFCKWAKQVKLYQSRIDRLIFRIIRSKKVQTAAKHLGIVLPRAPLLPIRFRKRRTHHRLLFHWGMEQIKGQYIARDGPRLIGPH